MGGNNRGKRRRFGAPRRLPSGRWQARYQGTDGLVRTAPNTFATQGEAARWLTLVEAEIVRGDWIDPYVGTVPLAEYADQWITERAKLRPRTASIYRSLLARHIKPKLGAFAVADLSAARVREWRAGLLAAGVSDTMTAKAYRLLRAVLNTAVDDDVIRRNPCRIKGAGSEHAAERPVATIDQVLDLAQLMPPRFRVLPLLATFCSLRYGELAALRRRDVDLQAATVRVRATLVELSNGQLIFGPPKSAAGLRIVSIPLEIVPVVESHVAEFVGGNAESLVFTGPKGAPLRRSNFQRAAKWSAHVAAVGLPGFHFHDLRHTGNTMASTTGASLRDLMARMGHDNIRAALIYQHTMHGRDRGIADGLDRQIAEQRARTAVHPKSDPEPPASGTELARKPTRRQK
jgi:integrase